VEINLAFVQILITDVTQQERFLSLPNDEVAFNEQWVVPLTMTNQAESDFANVAPDAWLTESTMIIEDAAATDDWLILNLQQIGETKIY
jgi:hypothetical protein